MNALDKVPADDNAAIVCTRRGFILTTLAGVLGTGLLTGGCRSPAGTDAALSKWSVWLLGAYAADREAVVRLGRAYLSACPAEQDRNALVAAIDTAVQAQRDAGSQQPGAALRRTVRADYATDSVVVIQGWVLSLTEARLYAAIALA